jgi:hypothetical protein
VELLLAQPPAFVSPGEHLKLYLETADGLVVLDPLASEPLLLSAEAGTIAGLAELPGGELLISGSEGLFLATEGGFISSPLNEALPDLSPSALYARGDGDDLDLWIVSPEQLLLWRSGSVYDLQPAGLAGGALEVTWGSLAGDQALWVGAGDSLYALVEEEGSFMAYPRTGDFAVSGLAVDAYGTLWAASDGDLWGRWPDSTEDVLELPFTTLDVAASADSGETWIATDDGLWLHDAGIFRPVDGAPPGALLGVDPVGRALIAGEDGLSRLSAGRPLLFLGVTDGTELADLSTLHLLPTITESFVGLTALLDGEPVTLDEDSGWSLQLDPDLLSDGAHELQASADYGDDEPVTASLFFSVGEFIPPTWSAHIEPLFQLECALCHQATAGATSAGGGHPIDTLAAWQTEIDGILEAVIDEQMPLNRPPLDDDQVGLIEDWRAGGFLE